MLDFISYLFPNIKKQKPGESFSTRRNMYQTALNEGHDARFFRFSPSEDGTIRGGHRGAEYLFFLLSFFEGIVFTKFGIPVLYTVGF